MYGTGSTPIADSQLGEPALQSRDQGRQQYVGGYAELHIKTQLEDCYRLLAIHPTAYLLFEVDVDLQGRVLRWFLVRKKFVSQQRKVQSLLRSL